MMPDFKAPYRWAMSDDGNDLLGMAQRYGPYSFVINEDKIARATAEDQGWELWNDPANAGRYAVQETDDWHGRSETPRVGKECVRTGRAWGSPYNNKKKK